MQIHINIFKLNYCELISTSPISKTSKFFTLLEVYCKEWALLAMGSVQIIKNARQSITSIVLVVLYYCCII